MFLSSTIQAGKDVTVQNMKSRLELLESYALTNETHEETLNNVQKELKIAKSEINRKTELIKHWKVKSESLEKEILDLKNNQPSIDPKALQTLQQHLKNTKEKAKEMEIHLERFERREKQYIRVLQRTVSHLENRPRTDPLIPLASDIDIKQVESMAQEISKQVLLLI